MKRLIGLIIVLGAFSVTMSGCESSSSSSGEDYQIFEEPRPVLKFIYETGPHTILSYSLNEHTTGLNVPLEYYRASGTDHRFRPARNLHNGKYTITVTHRPQSEPDNTSTVSISFIVSIPAIQTGDDSELDNGSGFIGNRDRPFPPSIVF